MAWQSRTRSRFQIFRFSKIQNLSRFSKYNLKYFSGFLNFWETAKSNSKEKQIDNMASLLQSQVNQILTQQALSRHWLAKSRKTFDFSNNSWTLILKKLRISDFQNWYFAYISKCMGTKWIGGLWQCSLNPCNHYFVIFELKYGSIGCRSQTNLDL